MGDWPNADKREKFRKLAEARTDKALAAIERVGKLSNPYLYEWEEPEVKKIVKALKEAVSSLESQFSKPSGSSSRGFKL
ncbi:MAG: hypothetical protein AAGH53_13480 [Pseudomonadota bacterium]